MKFLKSQGIVLVLAAVAILLVGKNLVWPFLKPKFASGPKAAPANPAPASTGAKPTVLQNVAQNLAGRVSEVLKTAQGQMPAAQATPPEKIDAQALQAQLAHWVASPLRDPFKMRGGVSDKSAREQLMLTGILRQTDSELAVINGLILSAGEMILGFQVEMVEPDRVWVKGPNGRESLEFKYLVPGPEKVVTVEVQPASLDAAKPAPEEAPAPAAAAIPTPEESAATTSGAEKPAPGKSPQESSAPVSPAPTSPAPISPAPTTAPLIGETEKSRESRRQGSGLANDFTAGPPIDR